MKRYKPIHPPRWATRFLHWYCKPQLLEDLEGDLNEYFERNRESKGANFARLVYIVDVFKFFRIYTIRKPSFSNPLIRSVMIASYVKTSGRSIIRNKLFSGINIIGLAISMSVGLLVVSLISDLYSYDKDLKNKERIFRVTTSDEQTGQSPMKFASTSWKAGEIIRRKIPGIEGIVIIRGDFGGDAKSGESILPISGLYANEGFFDVFSYPLLKGDPKTALKEPHSLILTETSATKFFGSQDVIGKIIKVDTISYRVTGLMKDLPKLSHMNFEALASLSSFDLKKPDGDGNYMSWTNIYSNYVYVLLSKNTSPVAFTANLDRLCKQENASLQNRKISLDLQSIKRILVGKPMANEIGPAINIAVVLTLAGLALVIILSACFNYTNLSIARSLRRSREVGIRKVIGAFKSQVIGQFIAESVIISLLSLCFAYLLFLVLRVQFLSFHPFLASIFSLDTSPKLLLYFFLLALGIGIIAGLLPALFYSKIKAILVLKDPSSLKAFRHLTLRKTLIIIQYTTSLIFITATIIGYNQYKGFLKFDLGFTTTNVLNIKMQGNKPEVFARELSAMPSVKAISRSLIISSLGSIYGASMKYKDPLDSTGVDLNNIDEHYLPLHNYKFLAGKNFTAHSKNTTETDVIVNEELIRRFNIGHKDPEKAIGENILIDKDRLTIIGVLRNFHYGTLENKIDPTAFRYSADPGAYLNVKIEKTNLPTTLAEIEEAWKRMDKVHPLDAKFYDDQIEEAYSQFSVMLKVIGFIAFLAISISSMGMFGMVIYTLEKRLKEISIRKVLGASEGMLLYLLSKGFLKLLLVAACIALPATWLFFDKVVLSSFAYHQPIRLGGILLGLMIVAVIAFLMIGVHTLKIVRSNPATVLKNE